MSSPSMPTYTYSGDPASSKKDAVRFLTGDCLLNDNHEVFNPVLSDQEIEWEIAQQGENQSTVYIASFAAEAMAGMFASRADVSIGPASSSYGDRAKRYYALSRSLRQRALRQDRPEPIFSHEEGEDIFSIGRMDYPGGTTQSSPIAAPWW